jgi:hypothetical protein
MTDEPRKHCAKRKRPDIKSHLGHDSIYRKCSKEANPQRQKIDKWLPGARGGKKKE